MRLALLMLSVVVCSSCTVTRERPVIEVRYDCKAEEAVPLDIKAFLNAPSRYVGKCVHTQGYVWGQTFFGDLHSVYSNARKESPEGVIAVYWPNREPRSRVYGDIIAMASTCEERGREPPPKVQVIEEAPRAEPSPYAPDIPETVLLTNDDSYCSFALRNVPILYVSLFKLNAGIPTRVYGPDATRRYSDLIEINDAWPFAADVRKNGDEWFESARKGELRRPLNDPNSPVGFLRAGTTIPKVKYFRVAPFVERNIRKVAPDFVYSAYGCVCKLDSCDEQWPVISADAIVSHEWPYICVEISRTMASTTVSYYMP